jgi:hypothetical protein
MGHDTLDSVEGVQVLVQSNLEQGSGSLSGNRNGKGAQRDQNLQPFQKSVVEVEPTEKY